MCSLRPFSTEKELDAERDEADLLRPLESRTELGDVQIVFMELPGVDAEDVSIDLDGLVVSSVDSPRSRR